MKKLKIGYLWVLLILFLGGFSYSIGSSVKPCSFSKQYHKQLKVKSNVSADSSDEKITIVRKRKLRGVEVTSIQISEIIFVGFFTYRTFKPLYPETVYTSFRYCVNPKRGPPIV